MTALAMFWEALGKADQGNFYDEPDTPFPDPIYRIRTKPGFIFDDSFWDVFHRFPFHICHVAYYGPARPDVPGRTSFDGVFELRFKPVEGEPP